MLRIEGESRRPSFPRSGIAWPRLPTGFFAGYSSGDLGQGEGDGIHQGFQEDLGGDGDHAR